MITCLSIFILFSLFIFDCIKNKWDGLWNFIFILLSIFCFTIFLFFNLIKNDVYLNWKLAKNNYMFELKKLYELKYIFFIKFTNEIWKILVISVKKQIFFIRSPKFLKLRRWSCFLICQNNSNKCRNPHKNRNNQFRYFQAYNHSNKFRIYRIFEFTVSWYSA